MTANRRPLAKRVSILRTGPKNPPLEMDIQSHVNPSNKSEEPLLEFAEGAFLSKEQRKSARKSAKAKDQEIKDEAFINRTLNRLANYLERRKNPTAGPGCPDPKKTYAEDAQARKRMLIEHGGSVVTNSEIRRK